MHIIAKALLFSMMLPLTATAVAQTQPLYGEPIPLMLAQKAVSAARENAEKNHLQMSIAVVDPGGQLVYFEKMDGGQTGSVNVAIDKARTAALYRRPTKFFEDQVASGGVGLRVLGMADVTPVDGGYPLIVGGKLVGAIGASGGSSKQDGECGLTGSSVLR